MTSAFSWQNSISLCLLHSAKRKKHFRGGESEGCTWKLLQGQSVIALMCAQACTCMLAIWGDSTLGKSRETLICLFSCICLYIVAVASASTAVR